MKSQTSLIIIIVLCLALGSLLFTENDSIWQRLYPETQANETENIGEEKPEYEINGFQSKTFNEEGLLSSTLNAKSLSYFTSSKLSILSEPLININPNKTNSTSGANSPEWQLKAKSATSISPNNKVILNKNIEMVRMKATPSSHELKIYSEKMELLIAEKIANSDEKVTVISNDNKIIGKGFTSNLDNNFISLKANVQSEYVSAEINKTNNSSKNKGNGSTEKEALYIQADSFLLEGNDQKAIYEGNVILIQSDITIRSDKIEVIKEGDNQIAFAYGKPAQFIQLPSGENQSIHAKAKRFVFDSREEKLKMYDNARLTQGDAILEGGYLYYDTRTENIGAESKAEKRVKMTLPNKTKP